MEGDREPLGYGAGIEVTINQCADQAFLGARSALGQRPVPAPLLRSQDAQGGLLQPTRPDQLSLGPGEHPALHRPLHHRIRMPTGTAAAGGDGGNRVVAGLGYRHQGQMVSTGAQPGALGTAAQKPRMSAGSGMSGLRISEVSGRWINDQEDRLHGDLGGQGIDRRTQRPHRQAVARARTAAARHRVGKIGPEDIRFQIL
ncbi:hypothetical protein LP52_15580 [Streptomonospora alba]|uniref:Uncharacterized protein n=1 Tax=Streptomonospora alba TaxID=183763 RepID=A0A0C2JML8_9ACTN|nr:hypothetical protein LP52_15580 [Streptomonospora alba]